MRSIVITGAGGMLAWDLERALKIKEPGASIFALTRDQLDIENRDQVAAVLSEIKPSVLLNCAAYTNVDGAERDPIAARGANSVGPANLVLACAEFRSALVHFSTDQVFGNERSAPRSEEDVPEPLNVYGRTKLAGERAVLEYDRSLVLRIQWLYGEQKDRFSVLRERKVFTPCSDQFGSPTWTRFISEIAIELCQKESRGLFHLVHDDFASWADVFAFVRKEWDLDVELRPVLTADLGLAAARPVFSVLSNEKLRRELSRASLGSWKDDLGNFLKLRQNK